jgi:hypothetical protein
MKIATVRVLSLGLALLAALVAFAPEQASAQRDRHDRRMVIINASNRTMLEFYATNTGTSHWGRDLLGQGVIPPGGRYVFDFNDRSGYCLFDFRAVLDDRRVVQRAKVNVCEATTWTIY